MPTTTRRATPQSDLDPHTNDGFGWRRLLRTSAAVGVAANIAVMVLNRFVGPSIVVLIAVLLIGLWLLRRPTRSGVVTIGVISLLDLTLHGPLTLFLLPILTYPKGWVPGVAALMASVVNVVAAAAVLRARSAGPSTAARTVGLAAVAIVGVGALVSLTAGLTAADEPAQPGDVVLVAADNHFSDQTLEAEAGAVTVHVTNTDPIMHTFVVPELDVILAVPNDSQRRVTFEAPPGEYAFHDEITLGDMRGMLRVR
ncbi:hypothetical protein BH20ACT8_BH20ACT8_07280 [soil metagenome]